MNDDAFVELASQAARMAGVDVKRARYIGLVVVAEHLESQAAGRRTAALYTETSRDRRIEQERATRYETRARALRSEAGKIAGERS
ncbi:MAG: hypothetical protein ABW146_08425 [Candidatus Sedimenticola sp. 6PFRAG7]